MRIGHFLVLSIALAACGKSSSGAVGTDALAPVPAPPGLVAELFVPHPQASWGHARDMIGGAAKLLPSSYPMLVATLLGLPQSAIELVDADVPTVGVAAADASGDLAVIAIHVRDGERLVAAMTQGVDGHFVAKPDPPSKITLLDPKPGQTSIAASLGVTGNYLLVAYAPDALLKLGPYAARTVPSHVASAQAEDVTMIAKHEALAGPLKERLARFWSGMKRQLEDADQAARQAHGGSAPTFGDPGAAIGKLEQTFQSLFAMMGDLDEARASLAMDDAGAHAKAILRAAPGGGPATQELAALATGPGKPLLDLPDDVSLAMLSRDTAEIRGRGAHDQADALAKLFEGKLSDADKKLLDDTLASWWKGRGDWLVAGGDLVEGHRAIFVETSVADAPTLDRGLRAMLDLPKVSAISEPISHWIGEVKITPPQPSGEGTFVAKIERKPPTLKLDGKDRKKASDTFEIGWTIAGDTADLVAAASAKDALGALAKAKTGTGSLATDPEVKKFVDALGNDVSFALLILPMRTVAALTGKKGEGLPSAPLVVGFGKGEGSAWFRVDAAPLAVRELARAQGLD